MFTHWLTYGINYMFNPHKHQWGDYKPALHKVNANPSLFCIGYECQSSGNSIEAYIWKAESISLLWDLVLHIGRDWMLYFAD